MSARRILACLAVAAVSACASSAPPKADHAAVEKEIRDVVTSWNGMIASRNDSAIAELYDSSAVLMPPNMPRVTGRDNIRSYWNGLWVIKPTLTLTPVAIASSVSGDLAVEEGNFAMEYPLSDGTPQTDTGKYLVIWRKTDKGWKVVRDIYNTDLPPAAPPSAKP